MRSSLRMIVIAFLAAMPLLLGSCHEDHPVSPAPWPYASIEDKVLALVNSHRASNGLGALVMVEVIRGQAREHSGNMAGGTTAFGHDGFDARIATIGKSMTVLAGGENVAWNQGYSDVAQAAFEAWLGSPGHLANINGDYNATGIGVTCTNDGRFYLTQIFIRRK